MVCQREEESDLDAKLDCFLEADSIEGLGVLVVTEVSLFLKKVNVAFDI